MDDQGKLSVEGVNKLAHTFLSEDPERLKKAEQFTDACKSGKSYYVFLNILLLLISPKKIKYFCIESELLNIG